MKNSLYALFSGLLLAAAWPTYGFSFLLFIGFVPLLLAEYRIRMSQTRNLKWKVLGLGYLSFFIWNLITTYWIYYSTPFGGVFAVLVNSLLMALVFLLYHMVAKRVNFKAAGSFLVSIWILFEYLHLNWEFSWPWLNLGNGFSETTQWIQWYEYTGTFGGTLWVLLVNLLILRSILLYHQYKEKGVLIRAAIQLVLLIGIPIGISYSILHNYEEGEEKIEVVVLQPNINPYTEKYHTTDARIGQLLMELADQAVTEQTRAVIAPETVFAGGTSYPSFDRSEAAFFTREFVRKHPQVNFLSGVAMYDRFSDASKVTSQSNLLGPDDWYNDYNSAFMVNAQDSVMFYHKSKLVVGVEHFPYQSVLKPILGDVMIDLGGTVAKKTMQEDRGVFQQLGGGEVGPIICYESVYGEFVGDYTTNGADYLAIITNDAWWGNTQGHQQHLSYARLRAIESRRSIARSANTGISAFINEKGEVLQTLGYEKQGALRGEVTLNDDITFYAKHGDYIARIAQFLGLFIFLFAVTRRRSQL